MPFTRLTWIDPDPHDEASSRPGNDPYEGFAEVNRGRWWLSLAYLLANLLAQGIHVHDRRADAAELESRGDCDDTRPHVGDHEVDGRSSSPAPCPSCQFRGQHSLAELAPRPLAGPGLTIPPATDSPSPLPGSPLRARCRAPPRG